MRVNPTCTRTLMIMCVCGRLHQLLSSSQTLIRITASAVSYGGSCHEGTLSKHTSGRSAPDHNIVFLFIIFFELLVIVYRSSDIKSCKLTRHTS